MKTNESKKSMITIKRKVKQKQQQQQLRGKEK